MEASIFSARPRSSEVRSPAKHPATAIGAGHSKDALRRFASTTSTGVEAILAGPAWPRKTTSPSPLTARARVDEPPQSKPRKISIRRVYLGRDVLCGVLSCALGAAFHL